MSSTNSFGLLGDDDAEDPSQILASKQQSPPAPAQGKKAQSQAAQPRNRPLANLPAKPVPLAQAVREAKHEEKRGGGRSAGLGRGRGGQGFDRDLTDNKNTSESADGFSGGFKLSEGGDDGKDPSERRPYGEPRGGGGFRGGRRAGFGDGRGRGGHGFNRDLSDNENRSGSADGFSGGYKLSEGGDTGKDPSERHPYGGPRGGGGFRSGHRGGFDDGETSEGDRPRRMFDRHSGTGRGSGFKREGAGRGNWGTPTDEIPTEVEEPVVEVEKNLELEKQSGQEDSGDTNKESPANEPEEREPEEKEMTLEEYEKVVEEKRKTLVSLKPEERKVNLDKELESMQLLSSKKNDDQYFVKLGSNKDKCKDPAEKSKRSVSINEFLKPAKGENYYRGGGRGRGRGRGRDRDGGNNYSAQAPAIEDVGEFPSLGSK